MQVDQGGWPQLSEVGLELEIVRDLEYAAPKLRL